ncbi:MAG: hypothetical protein AAGD96_02370 [Chloroflexota bacterium]
MRKNDGRATEIRKLIKDEFSASSLKDIFLAFQHHGLSTEQAPGQEKDQLVRFLVNSIHNKFNEDQIEEFRQYLIKERPNIDWDKSFDSEFQFIKHPADTNSLKKKLNKKKRLNFLTVIVVGIIFILIGALGYFTYLSPRSQPAELVQQPVSTQTEIQQPTRTVAPTRTIPPTLTNTPMPTSTALPPLVIAIATASPTSTPSPEVTPTQTSTPRPTMPPVVDSGIYFQLVIAWEGIPMYAGPSDTLNPLVAYLKKGTSYPILTKTLMDDYVSIWYTSGTENGIVGWVRIQDVYLDASITLEDITIDSIDGGPVPSPTAGPVRQSSKNLVAESGITPPAIEGELSACPVFIDLDQAKTTGDYLITWNAAILPQNATAMKVIVANIASSGSNSQGVLRDNNLDLAQMAAGTFYISALAFDEMSFVGGDTFSVSTIVFDIDGRDVCSDSIQFTWNREGLPAESD